MDHIIKYKEHPFYFKWQKLPKNIILLDDCVNFLQHVDLVILAIPTNYIGDFISSNKYNFKNGVTFLNLSKWIDVNSNLITSDLFESKLRGVNYTYSVLSWWMIAEDLILWSTVWADLWIRNLNLWKSIANLFISNHFSVNINFDYKSVELFWCLKNIVAIFIWYHLWKWENMSSIWAHFVDIVREINEIVSIYWGNSNFNFFNFSFWWDLITTCFWKSRSRQFWILLWEWHSFKDSFERLNSNNMYLEWVYTMRAVYEKIKHRKWFYNIKFLYSLIDDKRKF